MRLALRNVERDGILGWHVTTGSLGYGDNRPVVSGERMLYLSESTRGRGLETDLFPVKLCVRGMHACHTIIECLKHRSYSYLCRVKVFGPFEGTLCGGHHSSYYDTWEQFNQENVGKFVGAERQVLWMVPLSRVIDTNESPDYLRDLFKTPRQAEQALLSVVRKLRTKKESA